LSGIAPASRTCPPSLGANADPGTLTERRLTNLLHLGELLQQASKAQAGMDALLAWYRVRCAEADAQIEGEREYQVRLESDADLVQIVTIHSAKGLEYPVVFLPDLWGCKPRDATGLVAFHEGLQPCLDAGSDDLDAHLRLAERERLAEDLRLVYVALTRARSALYLAWGRVGSKDGHAGQTALGWLLHPHQDLASLLGAGPDAFASLPDLQPDLDALAKAAGGTLRVLPIPVSEAVVPIPAEATGADLSPRQPSRPVPRDWRITSFSELARNVHPGPTPPRDPAATDPALRFPAGSEAGSYLHALLEQIDFRTDVGRQVLDLSARISPRFGMDHQRWGADAATWLELVVNTPLDAQGLSLSRIAPMQRLSELEFDFAAAGVAIAALNLALQELWPEPQASLDAEGFSGLVTGVIDLVFEHGGRYYIADYKSNFLGPNPEDYAEDRLAAAVLAHRYDLQYLLYTLALHRYLGARLPGYAYERHFGGACYLFLRGMRPETGHRLGVFWARPDLALVERLDLQVFRRPETA
jgi:exodeoxyribonuclease V beta subunit